MKKLNLGCGKDHKKGWINLDAHKLPGVDIVHDLNKFPYPFKENEFDFVHASMILEHLEDCIKVMEEIHRIMKNKGVLRIHVPFFPSMYSVIDPTHKSFFTYLTFDYFTPKHGLNYYSKARFRIKRKKIVFSWNRFLNLFSFFINLFPVFYSRYLSFIFPSNELFVEMEAIKIKNETKK